jgi:DNA polymerase I-like protein with 3'-5' exonuclease and polymerase domains
MQQWYAHGAGLATQPEHHDAFLYGAGDVKIGSIVAPNEDEQNQRRIGKALKKKFLANTPGLKELIVAIKAAAQRGWVRGIDGRRIPIRSPHAALNSLLQNAGAVLMKLAPVLMYERLIAEGYVWGRDFAMVAHVHDEMQITARPEIAEYVGEIACWSIKEAGERLNFKCPMEGEAEIGTSWKDTH